jgi:hypothetical protein
MPIVWYLVFLVPVYPVQAAPSPAQAATDPAVFYVREVPAKPGVAPKVQDVREELPRTHRVSI